MPAISPRTETALEDLDALTDRIHQVRSTVWVAMADGVVTPAELASIETAWESVGESRGRVQWHLETLHGTIQIVRGLLYTGDVTPKLARRVREVTTGLRAIAPRKVA